MQFPKTENDVVALAEQMIAGVTAHPGDFSSITPTMLTALSAELNSFKEAKTSQDNSKGQLQVLTATKDEGLDMLVDVMKNDLKLAEIDCTNFPQLLAEIGWGAETDTHSYCCSRRADESPLDSGIGRRNMAWLGQAAGRQRGTGA